MEDSGIPIFIAVIISAVIVGVFIFVAAIVNAVLQSAL